MALNLSLVVLVVEDEPLIRLDAADMIEDTGCNVLQAGNADAALTTLKTRSDIQVLFTDIDMPGSIDGMELAHLVADKWPGISIIIASGKIGIDKMDLPTGAVLLAKPYPQTNVETALRDAARSRRPF
jgi:DNA-binding NtrC family response regulator